jgi:hypothetical protein
MVTASYEAPLISRHGQFDFEGRFTSGTANNPDLADA